MKVKKIDIGINHIGRVIHCADIHIRNWKRHTEYSNVFEKFRQDIVSIVDENTIITVGGDIVHAKTDMSPELIQMTNRFFTMLADIAPTIVITGNHDANLNNNNRLDALTPIIDALNHPNLFYLRDTGLYELGDCAFSIMSVFDTPDKYIKGDAIKKKYFKKIAMYHGTVGNSLTDTGMRLTSGLDITAFDGYDIGLLGDIHKRQILRQDPYVFFPGSMVQQNFGESYENHGYAILDLDESNYCFVDIPNDYGYCTIEVDGGKLPDQLILDQMNITPKTNVRIKTANTNSAQLKRALATIRKNYKVKDVIVHNTDKFKTTNDTDTSENYSIADVWNVDYQNTLISQYLEEQHVDDETILRVLDINKSIHTKLASVDHVRNVVWRPKRFEFSNMFSYGEGNVFDFTTKEGVYGLFAPNHTGKSAVLDAICFCLFDESFRATRADQILNNTKDWFECTLNFELDGFDYFIHKKTTKYKYGPLKGRLKVDIDFWYIDENNNKISLNGEQRKDTDKIIRSYVGSFEDFILTALSLQNNNSNFIDKTQSERKDLLANFLDLQVFDHLYDLCSEEIKTTNILLKEYEKEDFQTKLGDAERNRDRFQTRYTEVELQLERKQGECDDLNKDLVELASKLNVVDNTALDIDRLKTEQGSLESELEDQQLRKLQHEDSVEADKEKLNIVTTEFKSLYRPTIEAEYKTFIEKQKQIQVCEHAIENLKITVSNKLDKLQKLQEHEYDPNCIYCINNVFVKDAERTKKELDADKSNVSSLIKEKSNLDAYFNNNDIESVYAKLKELRQLSDKFSTQIKSKNLIIDGILNKIESISVRMQQNADRQSIYYRDVEKIKENHLLHEQVGIIQSKLDVCKKELAELTSQKQSIHSNAMIAEKVIKECEKNINHMQELAEKAYAYDFYIKAISRDGIPYKLISKAIPYIQAYANNILSQISDFRIEMETDGKNINAYINYDGNRWPLELSSGMERFISSLAIRIALIKISNLPRPDFIAIDEGLGVLDSTNLNSMHMFFMHMKELFKFTLIISHIDVVRDMVDNVISIDRKDGLSYINC
jgi:DNA repair exonuclease SbcCD ATPase subunit